MGATATVRIRVTTVHRFYAKRPLKSRRPKTPIIIRSHSWFTRLPFSGHLPSPVAIARNGSDQRGHHRLLAPFFPCNTHRVNVKISHLRGLGDPVPPPPPVPPPIPRCQRLTKDFKFGYHRLRFATSNTLVSTPSGFNWIGKITALGATRTPLRWPLRRLTVYPTQRPSHPSQRSAGVLFRVQKLWRSAPGHVTFAFTCSLVKVTWCFEVLPHGGAGSPNPAEAGVGPPRPVRGAGFQVLPTVPNIWRLLTGKTP